MDIYETMHALLKDLTRAHAQEIARLPYSIKYSSPAFLLHNTVEFDDALEAFEYLGDYIPFIIWSKNSTNGELSIAIDDPWINDFLDDALREIFESKIQEQASELEFADKYLDEFAGSADPTMFLEKCETSYHFDKAILKLNLPKLVTELTKFVEQSERECS